MANHSGSTCVINTGNILSLNDITKKSGQNPSDELIEAINITVKEYKSANSGGLKGEKICISRPSDDLTSKIQEQQVSDLKIGLKVFLNDDNKLSVKEAIDQGLATLQLPCIHSVILQVKKEKLIEGGDEFNSLKKVWNILEEYVKNGFIGEIGLADVEEATFRSVFEWATIKPTIIQINLSTCCVVPPSLQAFCKENDVQLLTHSDPSELLPNSTLSEILGIPLSIKWISRFLVHIRCRGVLCSKGYLVGLGNI